MSIRALGVGGGCLLFVLDEILLAVAFDLIEISAVFMILLNRISAEFFNSASFKAVLSL